MCARPQALQLVYSRDTGRGNSREGGGASPPSTRGSAPQALRSLPRGRARLPSPGESAQFGGRGGASRRSRTRHWSRKASLSQIGSSRPAPTRASAMARARARAPRPRPRLWRKSKFPRSKGWRRRDRPTGPRCAASTAQAERACAHRRPPRDERGRLRRGARGTGAVHRGGIRREPEGTRPHQGLNPKP